MSEPASEQQETDNTKITRDNFFPTHTLTLTQAPSFFPSSAVHTLSQSVPTTAQQTKVSERAPTSRSDHHHPHPISRATADDDDAADAQLVSIIAVERLDFLFLFLSLLRELHFIPGSITLLPSQFQQQQQQL